MGEMKTLPALQPHRLGMIHDGLVGISAYGLLARVWRMGHLPRHNLRAALGLTVRRGEDLLARTSAPTALQKRLAELYPQVDTRYWNLETWWMFDGVRQDAELVETLRECPSCARGCYHSLLFQMPGVTHCPWHGVALIDRCPRCHRGLQAGLASDLPPGSCPCGHDRVHPLETAMGAWEGDFRRAAVDGFIAEAQAHRTRHILLSPGGSTDPLALDVLSALAPDWSGVLGRTQVVKKQIEGVCIERIDMANSMRHAMPRLGDRSGLELFKPTTVSLPMAWYPPLRSIERRLTRIITTATGGIVPESDSELWWTLRRLPASPFGRTLFFQTEHLDETVRLALGHVANAIRPSQALRLGHANGNLGTRLRRHPVGTLLGERVLQRLLLRGHADGARVAVGRHVPALYDRAATRPWRRVPWVVFKLPVEGLPSARIAWTRQLGTV